MFECTMPLYHEADWRIWQSMALDEIPPGNRAEMCRQTFINATAGLFCIRGDNPRYGMEVYNRALRPHGRIQNARRG